MESVEYSPVLATFCFFLAFTLQNACTCIAMMNINTFYLAKKKTFDISLRLHERLTGNKGIQ